ncbi:MAG: TlpA family protein disulfide reductase [Flavobacteriaceae bacterium]|nr:TlpA family protein disulfide reductase [Flavobacteriaceae bacterium]
MFKKKKDILFYIAFFAFLIFINTSYGLGTKAKLTQGLTYIKSLLFPPKIANERLALSTYNVALKGINNAQNLNLKDAKGKVVFINHWATWCPPCRAEMPSLNNLYADYKNKVTFIFLTDESKNVVEKYYNAKNFDFPTYNLESRLPDEINTTSLPATFILDKQGKVSLEEFGASDWNSVKVRETLDRLLAE